MDLELTGKRALVTGATRGLGRAIAERLADEGCALAICARDPDELERAATAIRARGVVVHGGAVDVTDAPVLERFVAEAGEALGGIDLLVANAGGAAGVSRLEDATAGDWPTRAARSRSARATPTRSKVPPRRCEPEASRSTAAWST